MGQQCCVNDKNNSGAQIVEIEGTPADKAAPKLSDEPKAIDPQEPAPAPVQAPAQEQEEETKPEQATEDTKPTPSGMPMVFEDAQGADQTVYIQRKPLGLVFNQECPIKIDTFKENSHGQEIGVQKGWILKSLNGDDFTKLTEYKDAIALMKQHVESLPS